MAGMRTHKKFCYGCNRWRIRSSFYSNRRRPDGLQTQCKECQAKRRPAYHAAHREEDRSQRKARIRENTRKLLEYLATRGCADCPERDPIVLEFDHVRGKKKDHVARLVLKTYSWKTILKEIEKCEVRCANCHRRRTAKTRGFYKYLAAVDQSEDRRSVEPEAAGASPVRRVNVCP